MLCVAQTYSKRNVEEFPWCLQRALQNQVKTLQVLLLNSLLGVDPSVHVFLQATADGHSLKTFIRDERRLRSSYGD